ncbi:MAG TPA: hypothetical protein P5229_04340, partial [Candidatus Gracilibacteria bacterium]|nr:hypothetical protein [Candidatus Gracilibacteria bacterium]
MATATSIQMEELLKNVPDLNLPEPGQLVDGKIVAIHKNKIIMDLNGVATGMISGREAKDSEDTMKKAKVGDMITAFV